MPNIYNSKEQSIISQNLIDSSLSIATDLATMSVPVVTADANALTIRDKLTEQTFECASHIIVCDKDQFLGLIRIEDLFSADAHTTADVIMDKEPPLIKPGVDQEIAAWTAVRHK